MALEQEIVRDLRALNEKIARYLEADESRPRLERNFVFRRQLEPLLEDFRRSSIILLPPEDSGGSICPKCGKPI